MRSPSSSLTHAHKDERQTRMTVADARVRELVKLS